MAILGRSTHNKYNSDLLGRDNNTQSSEQLRWVLPLSHIFINRPQKLRFRLGLVVTGVLTSLLLSGCGDSDYTTIGQNASTSSGATSPTFPQATPTDWSIANFLRDFIINLFTGAARFVGDLAIGILTWLLQSAQSVRFNYSDNRVCAAVPNSGITLEPLTRCAVQVYDVLKYAPLMLWFIPVFYLLWRTVFAGMFPALEVNWLEFMLKLFGVSCFALVLDGVCTIVIDLPMRLFFWILNADPTNITFASISSTSSDVSGVATSLNNLTNLFSISPTIHKNDLLYVIVLSIIAIITALPVIAIGLFFLIRAVVLIIWFVFSPLALASLLLPETQSFYAQWQGRLVSMSISILPAAVIFKLAIIISQSVDAGQFNSNVFQFLLVLLAMLILFAAGGLICYRMFMSEARKIASTLKEGAGAARNVLGGFGLAREGMRAAQSGWDSVTAERFQLEEGEEANQISKIRNVGTRLKNRLLGVRAEEAEELIREDKERRRITQFTPNRNLLPSPMTDTSAQSSRDTSALVSSLQTMTFAFERLLRSGGGAAIGNWPMPNGVRTGGVGVGTGWAYPAGSPGATLQQGYITTIYGQPVGDALKTIDEQAQTEAQSQPQADSAVSDKPDFMEYHQLRRTSSQTRRPHSRVRRQSQNSIANSKDRKTRIKRRPTSVIKPRDPNRSPDNMGKGRPSWNKNVGDTGTPRANVTNTNNGYGWGVVSSSSGRSGEILVGSDNDIRALTPMQAQVAAMETHRLDKKGGVKSSLPLPTTGTTVKAEYPTIEAATPVVSDSISAPNSTALYSAPLAVNEGNSTRGEAAEVVSGGINSNSNSSGLASVPTITVQPTSIEAIASPAVPIAANSSSGNGNVGGNNSSPTSKSTKKRSPANPASGNSYISGLNWNGGQAIPTRSYGSYTVANPNAPTFAPVFNPATGTWEAPILLTQPQLPIEPVLNLNYRNLDRGSGKNSGPVSNSSFSSATNNDNGQPQTQVGAEIASDINLDQLVAGAGADL